ncbi:MAG: hypothetical protein HOI95_26585 [Chromatiales bacterium]|nr:hypothetical protein [Chromatiales bacterium]
MPSIKPTIPAAIANHPATIHGVPPPRVATSVSACEGQINYRVLAYRPLDYAEVTHIVGTSLALGWIDQPPAGETATVYTSIGLTQAVAPSQGCETEVTPNRPESAVVAPTLRPPPMGIERWMDQEVVPHVES